MSKNPKNKVEFGDLVSNPQNYVESFRNNIFRLMDIYDLSLRELSEKADMPFETLKSFLYGDAKDCKLSTAVKVARAFHVSIDELIGADTIDEKSRESLCISRNLPDYVVYLIRSFIRHQNKLQSQFDAKSVNIPVLLPQCANGYLPTTNITTTVCIDHLTNNLKSKIALGIQIPCEHYEPYYMPNEIILLAVDRDGLNGERCVVSYKGNYFFAIKRSYIENGEKKWKYISMMDGRTEVLKSDIDDKIGYIAGYLNPDGSWGVR
uniref:helix-turn-helix domain-containing protein n=1 Tax=Acetatifactor sp. TaxID=1872090 RepID=UPI004055C087